MEQQVNVYSLEGKSVRKITLPEIFQTPFRPKLINSVVNATITHRIQPQGVNKKAGQRNTAESLGPGRALARVPRVKGAGTSKAHQGAFAPGTRGGRQAFPPLVEKNLRKEVNKKERLFAIRSAIAITANKTKVGERGHVIDDLVDCPLVLVDDLEKLQKAKDVRELFKIIGVWGDIERSSVKKIRAGRGKMRGRRYKRKKSVLIVVGKNNGIYLGARNFIGVDICEVQNLNAELLAPGGHCGRLTIWSESAMNQLNSLFS
ncbi:MAG TPA: 50S ribosomal protein L4 [Candidatus Deferrimicrobium sp.]|nr:50S ribosomal protein L4 [Candidatus Deferrimicrobium sp.]